jgi:protease-4
VLGSDRIARAVAKLRKSGKPVIASMGDLAASGGYYVSALADEIYATPSTLTGSIGIFTYKADVRGLMAKLGVTAETAKRGEHADRFSVLRPWTDEERQQALQHIQGMYRLFLDTIAKGRAERGITAKRADELGRGQVWTGAQALGIGLVDKMGGLVAAIGEAARRGRALVGQAGLPELVVLPRPPAFGLRSLLGAEVGEPAQVPSVPPVTPPPTAPAPATSDAHGPAASVLSFVPSQGRAALRLLLPVLLGPGTGIEARMPYDLEIR